ncbi:glucosamine-6-phosphate deaminase [Vagococcus entomophilus]|uniref:Glucosamine-6-phosphate deaminase n=1 Tax=Vagococcus entomophilus TaxID=1160095 RepID=A0A430AKF5_9ENTE|nr:glucosamine-6-phosphate deaminase [Vagococcus entomophilus]RSU08591.1 glucosamine-6-phosphate deaminase [Vagococcus entomophilus]
MKIIRVQDQIAGGQTAFSIIKDAMEKNKLNVLGLATGSTPLSLYDQMIHSSLDFSDVVSINLDEYVGLPAENKQSYHYFMQEQLFKYKPFKKNYLPDGLAKDADRECKRYDEVLATHPIDIQILGIGQNGHIGFNEPGTPFDSLTRKVELTASTIEANQRFFEKKEDVPTHAFSMGINSIMQSKQIILLAYGKAKAQAIKAMIEESANENCPASALQHHPEVSVIVDHEAAMLLETK